jgi:hypothetical protein
VPGHICGRRAQRMGARTVAAAGYVAGGCVRPSAGPAGTAAGHRVGSGGRARGR